MSNNATSNETDLDWLARNVHAWPIKATFKVSLGWHGNKDGEPHYVRVDYGDEITKDQWLARRAELQNKPSWKDAPKWANWLAQDVDGAWYWHSCEPVAMGFAHISGIGKRMMQCSGEVLGDWRDTLERRPEDFNPFISIEGNQEKDMKQDNGWFERGELPPVGVVCEAYIDRPPQWIEAEIVAHKDGFAIGWCKSVMKGGQGDKASEFRPIRTEREAAIDRMQSDIAERWANCEELARHLVDKGWVKGGK